LSPQEVQQLKAWFDAVDRDKSGSITAQEIASMNFGTKTFRLDTADLLVKIFDTDRSGSIGFYEYAALHKFIMSVQNAFYAFDTDRSGSLEEAEVAQALGQAGFRFAPQVVRALIVKFAKQNASYTSRGLGLDFEAFIQLSGYLGVLRSAFTSQDYDRDGLITINFEQLVMMVAF